MCVYFIHISIHYIDTRALLGNTPRVKLIRNYIRDPSGIFSISPLVGISMTSFPAISSRRRVISYVYDSAAEVFVRSFLCQVHCLSRCCTLVTCRVYSFKTRVSDQPSTHFSNRITYLGPMLLFELVKIGPHVSEVWVELRCPTEKSHQPVNPQKKTNPSQVQSKLLA